MDLDILPIVNRLFEGVAQALAAGLVGLLLALLGLQALRRWRLVMNRLFARQRHPFVSLVSADWPAVTVLLTSDDPDETPALGRWQVMDYPEGRCHLQALALPAAGAERAAVLARALQAVPTPFVVVLDARHLPTPGLVQRLMAPFADPEVGAVNGRVVPAHPGVQRALRRGRFHDLYPSLFVDYYRGGGPSGSARLLSRLHGLEQAADAQIEQQARHNLGLLLPCAPGVLALRLAALHRVGGWRGDGRSPDADLACRLRMGGWLTVHQNRAECYQPIAPTWAARVRQTHHWARARQRALRCQALPLLCRRDLPLGLRLDGLLLLSAHLVAPLGVLTWTLAVLGWLPGPLGAVAGGSGTAVTVPLLLATVALGPAALGVGAGFWEIAAAAHLDRHQQRVRLVAFNGLGFIVSVAVVTRAVLLDLGWLPWARRRRPAALGGASSSSSAALPSVPAPSTGPARAVPGRPSSRPPSRPSTRPTTRPPSSPPTQPANLEPQA